MTEGGTWVRCSLRFLSRDAAGRPEAAPYMRCTSREPRRGGCQPPAEPRENAQSLAIAR